MPMRIIDWEQYPRRSHFTYFQSLAYPYVGLTVQADVTDLSRRTREGGESFFLACLYCAARAANGVPALRQRIVPEGIGEFDHCDTSHTVALDDGTSRYCRLDCRLLYPEFQRQGRARQEAAKAAAGIAREEDEDSLLFVSCIPWVSYTAVVQPVPCPADSNPRITFGRREEENGRFRMPLTLLAHHGLVDGLHIGQFFQKFQEETAALTR